ncbi:hypothetical protein [Streptomyces sp. NPDC057747]|uniref:hypothetical protein n=1 Tax=Streptomyces sp. NPDC057747 TaxID=3346238 RepID=UPI0036A964A0
MFHFRLEEPELVEPEALLALDRDEDFSPFLKFAQTRRSLERDTADGALSQDADAVAAHAQSPVLVAQTGRFALS